VCGRPLFANPVTYVDSKSPVFLSWVNITYDLPLAFFDLPSGIE